MAGSHPLDGAWLRFRRANAHLTEASGIVHKFGQDCRRHIVADNSNPSKPTFTLRAPDLPEMLPVVISDAIHNMRAALDYVVFEVARKDAGKVVGGTQFPIEGLKVDPTNPQRGFDARSGSYLKGLCAKHIGMIESFQPYVGVGWTKTLRDISNPDKHRNLTVINKDGSFVLTYHGDADLATQKPLVISPDEWNVDASYAIYVSPPNLSGPALMPSLYEIQAGVCNVLELFRTEF